MSTSIPDSASAVRAGLRPGTGPAVDPVALALRLTLVMLLLRPVGIGWLNITVLGVGTLGLVWPVALRNAGLWWLLAGLALIRVIGDWPMADNHAYLLGYWLLAVALCQSSVVFEGSLQRNARLLVGLTFVFASLWKVVLSPDYLDGSFFRFTMATDDRLETFTRFVAGLRPAELDALRSHFAAGGAIATAPETARYHLVAMLVTGWNVAINVALALAFLGRGWVARARNVLLIVYCATTYAVAAVDGFAWLLITMGIAQTRADQKATLIGYAVVFVLVIAYPA